MSQEGISYADEAAYLEQLDQDATENLGLAQKLQPAKRRAQTSVENATRPPVEAQEWSSANGQSSPRCSLPSQESTSRKSSEKEHASSRCSIRPPQHDLAAEASKLGYDSDFIASLPHEIVLEILEEKNREGERKTCQYLDASEGKLRTECVASTPAAEPAAPPRDLSTQDSAAACLTPRLPHCVEKYDPPAPPAAKRASVLEILEAALVVTSVGPPPLHDPSRMIPRRRQRAQPHVLRDAVFQLTQQDQMRAAEYHRMYRLAMSRTASD